MAGTRWTRTGWIAAVVAAAAFGYWRLAVPKHRVAVQSELVMLGDLDGDHRWTTVDLAVLDGWRAAPHDAAPALAWRADLNQNGLVDEEDVRLLQALVGAGSDPYAALEAARARGEPFPRPRELYRYVSLDAYLARPLWALPYPPARDSPLDWLAEWPVPASTGSYALALDAAVYDESVRLDQAWRRRAPGLLPSERAYAEGKLARARALRVAGDRYGLLLALVELTEDAETLTLRGQPEVAVRLLAFRDHLREVLASPLLAEVKAGRRERREVLAEVSRHLARDLDMTLDLEALGPARDLARLENYLQRSEWQYYKSSAHEADFRALVAYAQHDPRYLRAVARTSRKLQDPLVENHSLPMVLLYREALRVMGGDRKRAVGLLDEAIRNPYAWIRSIPRELLPGSLAADNFLLPGNKEDGADKSRHWNVFGGLCLYKSPQEAIELALRRELQDLREERDPAAGLDEFLRDMIANLNGMYHVMSVDPSLARR